MTGPAYAVLTLCRAPLATELGRQVSKRAAASCAATALPGWADLISWAARWWYEEGTDEEPDRLPAVRRFVLHVADRITETPPGSMSG